MHQDRFARIHTITAGWRQHSLFSISNALGDAVIGHMPGAHVSASAMPGPDGRVEPVADFHGWAETGWDVGELGAACGRRIAATLDDARGWIALGPSSAARQGLEAVKTTWSELEGRNLDQLTMLVTGNQPYFPPPARRTPAEDSPGPGQPLGPTQSLGLSQSLGLIGPDPETQARTEWAYQLTADPNPYVGQPFAGLGAGLAMSLMARGAQAVRAVDWVSTRTGLPDTITALAVGPGKALVVVSCELLDYTWMGSGTLSHITDLCAAAGVPCIAVVGGVDIGRREQRTIGLDAVYHVSDEPPNAAGALEDHVGLEALAARMESAARTWLREA